MTSARGARMSALKFSTKAFACAPRAENSLLRPSNAEFSVPGHAKSYLDQTLSKSRAYNISTVARSFINCMNSFATFLY